MNRLHVYTGPGKGKTTAAMGLALRFLGHGEKVLVAQFMKTGNSGELAALRRFENAVVMAAPPVQGFTFQMDAAQRTRTRVEQSAFAGEVRGAAARERPALIVLDELGVALACGMVDEAAGRALVDGALMQGETAVTGRDAPAWLVERADYLSRVEAVRHPYAAEGLAARRGVEY